MGFLGLRLKGNNFSFLTDVQFIQSLAILFGLFNLSVCLFEDQIGKFDWKQNYVGQIKFAHFDTVSTAKKIIIATEENVVAALNFKSGQILWRQVLERAQHGQIQYLHVESEVVSVSGQGPWLVRTWDPTTGRLLWEWSLSLTSPVRARKIHWFVTQGKLVQIVSTQESVIEVTSYNVHTGQNKGKTTQISAPWVKDLSRCIVTGTIFVCTSGPDSNSQLYYIDTTIDDSQVKTYPVQSLIGAVSGDVNISALEGTVPGIILTRNNINRIIFFENDEPKVLPNNISAPSKLLIMEHITEKVLLYASEVNESITVSAINLETGNEIPELTSYLDKPFTNSSLYAGLCAVKRDGSVACRYLIVTRDNAIHLLQNGGRVLWTREEALSHIVAVDILDLPVSDLDASIENEFDNKEENVEGSWDFWSMVVRRVVGQTKQLRLLAITLLGGNSHQDSVDSSLVRDEFGLHKLIVAATRVGKLYGIDNLSGRIIWQRYLPDVVPFTSNGNAQETMLLHVQRTTRHLPRPARCLLIARDAQNDHAVFYSFNPITGEALDGDLERPGYSIKQAMAFPKLTDEFLRPVLILDNELELHVIPESASSALTSDLANQMFLYTADMTTGALDGYAVSLNENSKPFALHTWRLQLGTRDQSITQLIPKISGERVHSQGRVLSDRSVLYKYVNPNLVAAVTQGNGAANIWLVDGVSGALVAGVAHRRVRGSVHLVHSENWLAYAYHNDKWRRTEVAALELYEGQAQSNASIWSSLAPPPPPLVERQAYVLGAVPAALAATRTDLGVTAKHVLLALTSGAVIELPWLFLDPRRPQHATPEMREEGVVPYVPELPLPNEAVINYNQTLQRIRGVHTSPAGLESTCLVLIHGLDIFYTRVAPSKTFDLLKDDFDYYLIIIVLSALLLASYITKQLASRKALRQAWK